MKDGDEHKPKTQALPYSARNNNALAELARGLTTPELRLMVELIAWANEQGDLWPSIPTIGSRCGMSDRNVRRTLQALQTANGSRPALVWTAENAGGVSHGRGRAAQRRVLLLTTEIQQAVTLAQRDRLASVEGGRRPVRKAGAGGRSTLAQAGSQHWRSAPANEGMGKASDEGKGEAAPKPPRVAAAASKASPDEQKAKIVAIFGEWHLRQEAYVIARNKAERWPPLVGLQHRPSVLMALVARLRALQIDPVAAAAWFCGSGSAGVIGHRLTWSELLDDCSIAAEREAVATLDAPPAVLAVGALLDSWARRVETDGFVRGRWACQHPAAFSPDVQKLVADLRKERSPAVAYIKGFIPFDAYLLATGRARKTTWAYVRRAVMRIGFDAPFERWKDALTDEEFEAEHAGTERPALVREA